MKLADFQKPAAPTEPVSAEESPNSEEPQGYTSITPSGIEVYYSWEPRRHYKLRVAGITWDNGEPPWVEVPSVTTVLGVLDKSGPLTWWGQGVGVDGTLQLIRDEYAVPTMSKDEVVALLTQHKLTVNHAKDKAADRGVNVHGALEKWAETGFVPEPTVWPEHERGYVEGLRDFLRAVGEPDAIDTELMVGSLEHQYAGRFDLVLTLSRPVEVVTKCYPKKPPKIEEIPAGRVLIDMKTSKRIYPATHFMQLEAYEAAAVECGYAPTDYRAVLHVTADGQYEFAINRDWTFEDFLSVRQCYQTMHERKIVQALRDELDAKDAA